MPYRRGVRLGCDYSYARPDPAALVRWGATFVVRYVADTPGVDGKRLTRAEADRLSAAGLDLVAVWQTSKRFMTGGRGAGFRDASAAHANLLAAGGPASAPIYFAADWDVTADEQGAVNSYLAGARAALGGNRVGLYGGYATVTRAVEYWRRTYPGDRLRLWQTLAWSGGRWAQVDLRQTEIEIRIGGAACDRDEAHSVDFGQWRAGMGLWLPGAERRDQGGGDMVGGDAYATHHITFDQLKADGSQPAFSAVAGYLESVNFEPHLIIDPFGRHDPIQWFPADRSARALRDEAGGNRTNRYGRLNVQIEWFFTPGCVVAGKRYATLADTPMAHLDEVMAWLRSHGVPDRWPIAPPKTSGNVRRWPAGGGHMGHCHWPENDHTDPGPMPDIFSATPAPRDLEDEIMAMTPAERADFIHDIAAEVITYEAADPAASPGPDGKPVMKRLVEFWRYADFLHLGDRKVTKEEAAKLAAKIDALQTKVDALSVGGGTVDVEALAAAVADRLAKRLES